LKIYHCIRSGLESTPPTLLVRDIPHFDLGKEINNNATDICQNFCECYCDTPTNLTKQGSGAWDQMQTSPLYKGDCTSEVFTALLFILILKIVLQNFLEYLQVTCKNKKAAVKDVAELLENNDQEFNKVVSKPEEEMQKEQYENFQLVIAPCKKNGTPCCSYLKVGGTLLDYDELIVQFGYCVLFVAAFPFAPFLAFFNNVLEILLDSHKLTKMTRQPHPSGARDIGSWSTCLSLLSWTAVAVNVGIILFDEEVEWINPSPTYRISIFILVEHILVSVKVSIDYIIPDFPLVVKERISRQTLVHDIYLGQKTNLH